jgi:hypothetical protein
MPINKDALVKPFKPEIKTFMSKGFGPGKSNKGYDVTYVQSEHYIRRINEAFGHMVTTQVLSVEEKTDPITKKVSLLCHLKVIAIVDESIIEKEDFGGCDLRWVSHNRKTSEKVWKSRDYIDAYKTAFTDAFKRCCRQLGIGIEIACGPEPGFEYDGEIPPNDNKKPDDKATKEQWLEIRKLSGIDPSESESHKKRYKEFVEQLCKGLNADPKKLTGYQAKAIIDKLKSTNGKSDDK